eukprot:g43211.t1
MAVLASIALEPGIKVHKMQQLKDTHGPLEPSSPPVSSDSIPSPKDPTSYAKRQLSDTSSYLPVDHDPTMTHQAIVSTTEGLRAFHFFLEQRSEPSSLTTTLLRLAELILTLNNFSFNPSHFLQ